MIVDVLYEGLVLATGVEASSSGESGGDRLFVELESPMPVGTHVIVRSPDGEKLARVEAVAETGKPGVVVRLGVKPRASEPAPRASEPAPAPSAPAAAPGAAIEESKNGESPDDDGDKEPPQKGGRKRRNTRKTVLGH
jgi:hypothetical protein